RVRRESVVSRIVSLPSHWLVFPDSCGAYPAALRLDHSKAIATRGRDLGDGRTDLHLPHGSICRHLPGPGQPDDVPGFHLYRQLDVLDVAWRTRDLPGRHPRDHVVGYSQA